MIYVVVASKMRVTKILNILWERNTSDMLLCEIVKYCTIYGESPIVKSIVQAYALTREAWDACRAWNDLIVESLCTF